jgi:alkylation response protein AidB-like acyl-CoA dehydrogenase
MIEDNFKASPADDAFREEVRAFLVKQLPSAIRDKVKDGRALLKDELAAWHSTLLAKGWIAPNWPNEHGGTGWSATRPGSSRRSITPTTARRCTCSTSRCWGRS